MSAGAYETFARPEPHVRAARPPAEFAERLAAIRTVEREAALPRLWRELPLSTRIILVMLAVSQPATGPGNFEERMRRIAQQPWESFSRVDQEAIASTSRAVVVDLSKLAAVA